MSAGVGNAVYVRREFPVWAITRSLGLLLVLVAVFGAAQPMLLLVGCGLMGLDQVARA